MAVNGEGAKHCQTAPWRRVKLFVTASSLFVFGMGPVLILINLGSDLEQPLTLSGIDLFRPWLFGALGGMIGGSARAIWAFIVEVRAFEIYLRTGQQPKTMTRLFNEPVEHWFDFMWVWYLYLMKPIAGALIGFIVALLQEYGLVPFLGGHNSRNAYGIVVVAFLGGLFTEDVIDQLGRLLRRKREGVSQDD
jgi:hypothetical protein